MCTSSQYFRNLRMTLERSHCWWGPDLVGIQRELTPQSPRQTLQSRDSAIHATVCEDWHQNWTWDLPLLTQKSNDCAWRMPPCLVEVVPEIGRGIEMLNKEIPSLCASQLHLTGRAPGWTSRWEKGKFSPLTPTPPLPLSYCPEKSELGSSVSLYSSFLGVSSRSASDWEIHHWLPWF